MTDSKLASALEPGDVVQLESPRSRARVIRNGTMESILLTCHRLGPQQDPQPARDLRIEMLDDRWRGTRDYVFVHPEERVRLA